MDFTETAPAALDRAAATVAAARAVMYEVASKLAGMHAIEHRALVGSLPGVTADVRAARLGMLEQVADELVSLCVDLKLDPPARLLTMKLAPLPVTP